jgi:type III secretion protein V
MSAATTIDRLTSRNDIALAGLIVAIIFMMIIPMPTTVMDFLIGANMTLSAVLLMVAIYLPSPLAFSSFPSVLLVATLFRLGISIATTRLILLEGDAGHIIETFGNFVVGGNLVVGLVAFMILTIVQFVVITKGSERVAEVAARFSLDAMPGKQMAIDADLRANAIDMDEARARRALVEKESQLYGAMDGAMKFVKGDAIAGLIIVAVNLLGGILIGTLQRDMALAEAAGVYSILTIGDGLIAQIPALFTAICSGIIVTRVPASAHPSNVGRDIGAQILAQPRALMIAGAIAVGLGLVPGMPAATFFGLATVVGGLGLALVRGSRSPDDPPARGTTGVAADAAVEAKGKKPGAASQAFTTSQPLMVDVAPNLSDKLLATALNDELMQVRRALYQELGIPFPGIQLRYNEAFGDNDYVILLFEVPVGRGRLRPGEVLVRDSRQVLDAMGIPCGDIVTFLPGATGVWVNAEHEQALAAAGIPSLNPARVILWHLTQVITKHAAEFIGIQEVRTLLVAMEEAYPDLVKEVQRVMPLQKIAEIIQRLVSEEVSVRNLRLVFESLIEWGQKEKDTVLLAEYIRVSLKRHISFKHAQGGTLLPAYLLAPNVEERVRGAIRQTSAGSYLALDPPVSRSLIDNIRAAVGDLSATMQRPVLLTTMDIRRYVRKLIEADLYDLPVVSYQELTPEINVQPLARIEL